MGVGGPDSFVVKDYESAFFYVIVPFLYEEEKHNNLTLFSVSGGEKDSSDEEPRYWLNFSK